MRRNQGGRSCNPGFSLLYLKNVPDHWKSSHSDRRCCRNIGYHVPILPPSGSWNSEERTWLLYDAQTVKTDGEAILENELELRFETASDVAETLVDDTSLTLTELNERLAETRQAGGQLRDLQFTFHSRIADAFSAFIFALIASVLGLQLHGRAAGFGWTIVLLVLFWALWTLSSSLFDQNVLSPIVAAWLTSGLVGVVGLIVAWWRLR